MELSLEQVEKVANLAQVQLSLEEKARIAADLSHAITYIDELSAVDVSTVGEDAAGNSQITGVANVTDADEVKNCEIDREVFLRNAPMSEGAYIKVKKILSK